MSKYMESLLLVQNSVGCAAGVCSVNQVVPSIDSSGEMAGRREFTRRKPSKKVSLLQMAAPRTVTGTYAGISEVFVKPRNNY